MIILTYQANIIEVIRKMKEKLLSTLIAIMLFSHSFASIEESKNDHQEIITDELAIISIETKDYNNDFSNEEKLAE